MRTAQKVGLYLSPFIFVSFVLITLISTRESCSHIPVVGDASRSDSHTRLQVAETSPPHGGSRQATPHVEQDHEDPWRVIDIEKAIPPISELNRRFVIATGVSENHIEELMPFLANVQEFMPETKVLVFDLGLTPDNISMIETICQVEVRPFNFDDYPPHVSRIRTYAFKPIIIDMVVREFGVMFWGDASIRLKSSLLPLLPLALKHHGFISRFKAFNVNVLDHGKFHQHKYTHPKMYENFGINVTEYVNSGDNATYLVAGQQLYINSSYIQERLLQPYVACALVERCIEPEGANINNHRYDASLMNIIVYKNLRAEWTPDNNDNDAFMATQVVSRRDRTSKSPKFCIK